MGTLIGKSLNYKIGADTSGFTRGMVASKRELRDATRMMNQTRTPAERYARQVDKTGTLLRKGAIDHETYTRRVRQLRLEKLRGIPVIGRFASAMAGAHPAVVAAGFALAAFTAAMVLARRAARALTDTVKTQLEELDKLAKSAAVVEMTGQALAGLRLAAAEFSGVASDKFDKAIKKMNVQIGYAATGTGTAKDALDDLGMSVKDLEGQSADETFKDLADAIARIPDAARQAYLAQQLFGRGGVELLATLRQGRTGLEQLQQAFRDAYGELTQEDLKTIQDANDAMGRLGVVWSGLSARLTVEVAGAIKPIADALVEATDESSEFGKTLRQAIDLVGPGLAVSADLLNGMVGNLQMVQAQALSTMAAILTAVEQADKARAALTGGEANEDLQIYADSVRNQAFATGKEGLERSISSATWEMTNQFLASQDAVAGMNDQLDRGADLIDDEDEAAKLLAQNMEMAKQKAAGLAVELGQEIDLFGANDATRNVAAGLKMLADGVADTTVKLILANQEKLAFLEADKKLADQQQITADKATDLAAALKEQIDLFDANDATSNVAAGLKMLADGVDAATVKLILLRQEKLAFLEADKELTKRGEQLTSSLQSPTERAAKELDEYKRLYDEGKIAAETYKRAIEKVRDDLKPPVTTTFEVLGVGAAVSGSQRAAEAIARFRERTKNISGGIQLDDARKEANRKFDEPPKPRAYLKPTGPNTQKIVRPPLPDVPEGPPPTYTWVGGKRVWNTPSAEDANQLARPPEAAEDAGQLPRPPEAAEDADQYVADMRAAGREIWDNDPTPEQTAAETRPISPETKDEAAAENARQATLQRIADLLEDINEKTTGETPEKKKVML